MRNPDRPTWIRGLTDELRGHADYTVDRLVAVLDAVDRDRARRHVAVPVESEVTEDSSVHGIGKGLRRNGGAGSVGLRECIEDDLHRLPGDWGTAELELETQG